MRELVLLHAGTIRVESEVGKGSRFIVTLKAGVTHLPKDQIGPVGEPAPVGSVAAPFVQEASQWLPQADPGPGTQPRTAVEPARAPSGADLESAAGAHPVGR